MPYKRNNTNRRKRNLGTKRSSKRMSYATRRYNPKKRGELIAFHKSSDLSDDGVIIAKYPNDKRNIKNIDTKPEPKGTIIFWLRMRLFATGTATTGLCVHDATHHGKASVRGGGIDYLFLDVALLAVDWLLIRYVASGEVCKGQTRSHYIIVQEKIRIGESNACCRYREYWKVDILLPPKGVPLVEVELADLRRLSFLNGSMRSSMNLLISRGLSSRL